MFSAIVEFFESILKLKLKKQQKDTKKELKKEVNNSKEDVITAKEKAKKSKKVVDSKEKEKQLKIKVLIVKVIKWIVTIIEQFITWLISLIGIYGFFIILVVLVLMIAIYGLLHIDLTIIDSIFSGNDNCVQGSQVVTDINFDENVLNQNGGTLTEQQQNLYRSAKVYTDIYNGVFGNPAELFNEDYKNLIEKTDTVTKVAATMGFMSIENGFSFPGSSNILSIPTTTQPDGNNDAWLGLEAEKKDFDGKYEGATYYSESFVQSFKKTYSYSDYNNLISCYNYAPYGMAIQIGFLSGKYSAWINTHNYINTELPNLAQKFGISANIDKLNSLCHYFMLANGYHGHNSSMDEPELIFWCALWASTSDNDSERGFDKIELNSPNYDESTYRGEILGYSSWNGTYCGSPTKISNLTYIADSKVNGRLKINGKELDKPLVTFVKEYCDSKGLGDVFQPVLNDLNNRAYASTLERAVLNQNYSYGLVAYLAGLKVMNDLGVSMPLASGGSYEDCECVENNSKGILGFLNRIFNKDNVKKSEIQGPYSEELKEKMRKNSTYKDLYGYFGSLQGTDSGYKNFGGMTSLEWMENSKWKVPYLYQFNDADYEGPLKNVKYGANKYGSACPTFQMAYVYSALTGCAVNIAEIQAAITEYSGENSVSFSNFAKVAKESGVYVRGMLYSNGVYEDKTNVVTKEEAPILFPDESLSLKEQIDYVLENNGIVGVTTGNSSPYVHGTVHYFCIIEKKGENEYYTYSASSPSLDGEAHTLEYIIGNNGAYLYKDFNTNLLFAYNPSLTSGESLETQKILFLGDSFTDGLNSNIGLTSKGFMVEAEVGKSPSYWDDDTKINSLPSEVDNVVVLLGVNNPLEVDSMKSLINKLKTKYNKPIYVQKVFPLGSNYTINDLTTTMNSINTFNDSIKSFCDSTDGVNFIDTTSGLVDSNGYLLNADSEGLHLTKKEDYEKWWSNISSAIGISASNKVSNATSNCISETKKTSSAGALDFDKDIIDVTDMCKPSWSNNNSGTIDKVECIVIHYWGHTAKTRGSVEDNWLSTYSQGHSAMAQYMVDYEGAYRVAPDNVAVHHSGYKGGGCIGYNITGGNSVGVSFYCGNTNAVGIEIANVCVGTDTYAFEKTVMENAIALTKSLMIEYNIDSDHVLRHWDCTMKPCPAPFVDKQYGSPSNIPKEESKYDHQKSTGWVAFKNALNSDTIDWNSFGDSVIEDIQ